MHKQFKTHIHKNSLFTQTDKLLVAFSGGIDSVVLAHLLLKVGYNFELAHCNFKLRGQDADDDTEFCKTFSEKINCSLHLNYFDTSEFAVTEKLSIQMAARKLRYDWFRVLVQRHNFKYILTAHHASDNVETLLINLVRGTGIKGLKGINEKYKQIVRPLLYATKTEINHYAIENDLQYRTDGSNAEIKYKRNYIRHEIVPALKKMNPSFEETLINSIVVFKQSSEIIEEFAAKKFTEICKVEKNLLFIHINNLLKEKQKETLLYEWLSPKNFKTTHLQQLAEVLKTNKITGKQFASSTHVLVIDRDYIIVKKNEQQQQQALIEFIINDINDTSDLPIKLNFLETTSKNFSKEKNEISIPYTNTTFPLTLRKWKTGDKFKPFGVKGFKKLSDFFKDQKLSLFEKQEVWILANDEHIIWVLGYRMDERCRINELTASALNITFTTLL